MGDFNSKHNRTVWVDIPVADLDRAATFYRAVLDVKVQKESFGDVEFCVLDHQEGNGGCLVKKEAEISAEQGILVYMNVDGRIKSAVDGVKANGGRILQEVHSIGPHGFRALVVDSEGNRLALHSNSDS